MRQAAIVLSGSLPAFWLTVLVPETLLEAEKGLTPYPSPGNFDGMLIRSSSAVWMSDLSYPIDVVWIKDITWSRGTVVHIQTLYPGDLTHYGHRDAHRVLELRAGWAKDFHLEVGDAYRWVG